MSRVIHVCMSHVTHMTASRHTVGPFIEGSCCGRGVNESCHMAHMACVYESDEQGMLHACV